MKDLSSNFQVLEDQGISVLGISMDSQASHKTFAEKFGLKIRLLVDEDHAISKAYGVDSEYQGTPMAKRHTFLINEEGTLLTRIESVDVNNHATQILDALKAMTE